MRLLRGVALSLLSLILLACLLEAGLRLAGYGDKPARYYDPHIGPRFHSNQQRMSFGRDGPPVPFSTNEAGFRGPWHAGAKPPGAVRITCLGDSFTFGWGVGDEGAYPAQLERLLAAELGADKVQVLNLGLPDHNTRNALAVYRRIARERAPDVVLLGWYLNDVQPDGGGPRYTDSWIFKLLARTATLEWFHYRLRGRIPLFRAERSPELLAQRELYSRNAEAIEMEPGSELARPFWEAAMGDLRELAEAVRADGRSLVVLLFPSAGQVATLREQAKAGMDAQALLSGPLTAPQRQVRGVAAELGLPVIDLLLPLAGCREEPFGPDDPGHPSVAGFAATAELVRRALHEHGWLQAR